MSAHRPALAALLLAALPAAAVDHGPAVHASLGTGACAEAHTDATRVDNPCWLQLGLAPAWRLGHLEVGAVYEGRELLNLLTLFLVAPPRATVLGGTVGAVFEPGRRWRLLAAGEAGWRGYLDFAGHGLRDRKGTAVVPYLGATGRAGFGLRPQSGWTDRLEVSLSLRSDRRTATSTVDGVPWRVGGWSLTMGLGLVSDW